MWQKNCESRTITAKLHCSLFFTQSLSQIVVNAKLDRPLDSHAPQTEYMYHYDDDDRGEEYENEYENQWDTEEEYVQMEDAHESYPTEQDYEQEHYETNDQEENQDQDDNLDEDDQDNYEWHEVDGQPPTMDIYMPELRRAGNITNRKGNIRNWKH